jgi:type IV pilus assembly protein PilA
MKNWSKLPWMIGASVAVLGVVAYVALQPTYHNYQVQSKLADVFPSVDACRANITQIVQKTKVPALSAALFGCDGGASSGVKISRHLKSIAVSNAGMITVTLDYRSLAELTPTSSVLTVVPLLDATTELKTTDVRKAIAQWRCGSAQDGTTIPSQYLPSNCRG